EAPSCGTVGNPDFYGLGIRVGIYLQWLTALLANRYLHDEIQPNLDTNTIFLLAISVATMLASVQQTATVPEIVVLLHLCFGFILSVLSVWGYRTRSTALVVAICVYSTWFWFSALDRLDDGECVHYGFTFAKVDVRGGIRHLYQALSLIAVVMYGILWLRELMIAALFFGITSIQITFKAIAVTWFCQQNDK
ncbi:hypothetical protein P154DRAFT_417662, partial [Amniculicola lignicola CBS 123094]